MTLSVCCQNLPLVRALRSKPVAITASYFDLRHRSIWSPVLQWKSASDVHTQKTTPYLKDGDGVHATWTAPRMIKKNPSAVSPSLTIVCLGINFTSGISMASCSFVFLSIQANVSTESMATSFAASLIAKPKNSVSPQPSALIAAIGRNSPLVSHCRRGIKSSSGYHSGYHISWHDN